MNIKSLQNHMARDQNGQYYHNLGPHPRKQLLERFDRKHASKMYVDGPDGRAIHIGYVIAGQWLTIYKVERMERAA
jgi:hypothetical protein